MDNEKQINTTDNHLGIFFIIAAILVVFSIAFPFLVNCWFSDWEKSGTFGDTFGALNALFSGLAFAGVITTILIQKSELKNQRIELQLQRIEMQETRKEFLINRTTNLVYNQLDRFEKCLKDLSITYNDINHQGNNAVSFLEEIEITITRQSNNSEEDYNEIRRAAIIELLKIYFPNKSKIETFAKNAYNSVEVLKRLIYKTELEIEELNDIKNLFFVNIGFINMRVIEQISNVANDELTYLKLEDYRNNNIDIGSLLIANIYLTSIKEFYKKQKTTTENPILFTRNRTG